MKFYLAAGCLVLWQLLIAYLAYLFGRSFQVKCFYRMLDYYARQHVHTPEGVKAVSTLKTLLKSKGL